jgi:lipoate-protein ligase A
MSKPLLKLLYLQNKPILEQLLIEEALLRADKGNWCVFNTGTVPGIVLGVSSKVEQHIHSEKMAQKPVPLIRRFTGGGTVFVDENTCFVTTICNEECSGTPCKIEPILHWNGALYSGLVDGFHVVENDYAIADKKFGGNAQYHTKKRWLLHSSLLWDFKKSNMEYLLFPPKVPKYREERSHGDFLCCLKDKISTKQKIFDHVVSKLGLKFEIEEVTEDMAKKIVDLPHRQSTVLVSCIL